MDLSFGISLFRRLPIPSDRFGIVLAHSTSIFIHPAQIELGLGQPLIRRLPIPFDRFGIVLAHSLPLFIHHAQTILSLSIPLFCRLAIPLHCLFIILTNSFAFVIHPTQIILGVCIPLLRSLKHFLKIWHIINPSCLPYAQSQQSNHHFFQPCVHLKILFYSECFWVCLCISDDLGKGFIILLNPMYGKHYNFVVVP